MRNKTKSFKTLADVMRERQAFAFEDVIIGIIVNQQAALITYQKPDHPLTSRVIYPYIYGFLKGTNNKAIRAYQFTGATATELGWKIFRLDRIFSVTPYGQLPDAPPPLYNTTGLDRGFINVVVSAKLDGKASPAPITDTTTVTDIKGAPVRIGDIDPTTGVRRAAPVWEEINRIINIVKKWKNKRK